MQLAELAGAGLEPDEAFLIAARRIGTMEDARAVLDRTPDDARDEPAESAAEQADATAKQADATAEQSGGLWQRLGLAAGTAGPEARREIAVMGALAFSAAVAIKVPEIFGLQLEHDGEFYARNVSLLVLPFLAGYLAWKRDLGPRSLALLAAAFAAPAAVVNAYPFDGGRDTSDTEILAALHLPILLWLVVGLAHASGDWRSHDKRMGFVRFTGEWALYYGLIAIAGQIALGVLVFLLEALDIDSTLIIEWVLPGGAAGAAVVAAWLAETRGGVLERIAPVMTSILSPLLALALLGFLAVAAATGRAADMDREVLIFFDVLLALVLGLVIYSTAVRDPHKPPGIFDFAHLALIAAALLADVLMLGAIVGRLSDFGSTPNRVAALGENLVLLANLAWAARLQFGFWVGRLPLASVERWQTGYAPVYALWAAAVVVVFPPAFGFA